MTVTINKNKRRRVVEKTARRAQQASLDGVPTVGTIAVIGYYVDLPTAFSKTKPIGKRK